MRLSSPLAECILVSAWLFWSLRLSGAIAIPTRKHTPMGRRIDVPALTPLAERAPRIASSPVALNSSSVQSSQLPATLLAVSEPSIPTPFALLKGVGKTVVSTKASSFPRTIPIITTRSNGQLSTSEQVITGVFTTVVPIFTSGTATPLAQSDGDSSVNPGVIIGPVLIVIVILTVPWFIMHRLRKAVLRGGTKIAPPTPESSSPKVDASEYEYNISRPSWQAHVAGSDFRSVDRTLTTSSLSTTRQLYISNQVNRAREKVRELEELSLVLRSVSHSSHNTGIVPDTSRADVVSGRSLPPEISEVQALEDRLQHALREIQELNLRMQEMERQRSSDWALGLSGEFPPLYTE